MHTTRNSNEIPPNCPASGVANDTKVLTLWLNFSKIPLQINPPVHRPTTTGACLRNHAWWFCLCMARGCNLDLEARTLRVANHVHTFARVVHEGLDLDVDAIYLLPHVFQGSQVIEHVHTQQPGPRMRAVNGWSQVRYAFVGWEHSMHQNYWTVGATDATPNQNCDQACSVHFNVVYVQQASSRSILIRGFPRHFYNFIRSRASIRRSIYPGS